MAVSVDFANTKVISVPKADMTLIQPSPEIRALDIDAFRKELKDLEADVFGMPWTDTHAHTQPQTIGGVTLARVVEILAPYTITFEDGQYAVNLVGANSNISDRANVNQVSIRSANSAGLTDPGLDEDTIAQAVRDISLAITLDGSLGRGVLVAQNVKLAYRIDNYRRNGLTGFADSARLRVFANQADADASTPGSPDGDDGEIGRATIQGTPHGTYTVLPIDIVAGA